MKINQLLIRFFSVLFIISVFLVSINTSVLNTNFYSKQYEKNNTTLATGVSLSELCVVTQNLLDYLTEERENLDMTATVNGAVQEVFDPNEKEHMVDVQSLYNTALRASNGAVLLALLCLLLVLMRAKKASVLLIAQGFLSTSFFVYAIALVLGGVIFLNFQSFWTLFHQMIFTNDLWLLDPAVSVMINMFPLEFFFQLCFFILAKFVGVMTLFSFVCFVVKRKAKQH